jgi:hypothetical protein
MGETKLVEHELRGVDIAIAHATVFDCFKYARGEK